MRRASTSCLAVLLILASGTSSGREICWIDHVERSTGGVAVFFSVPTSVVAMVEPKENPSAGRYLVRDAIVSRNGVESDHLTLASGATAYLSQTPEDVCTLVSVDGPDRTGILASAWNHMPGVPPTTASRFIPVR